MASTQDLQEQSLTFYSTREGSLISEPNTLSLIVHEPSNQSSWVITALIQQSLSTDNECYLSPQSPPKSKDSFKTFLHTFANTEQSYSKYLNKYITKNKSNFNFHSYLTMPEKLASWDTQLLSQLKKEKNPVVILENPELILSIIPGMTIQKLLSQIQELQKYCILYITTPIVNSTFLSALLHRSSLIVSLTSLTTGRADDMSGTLSVSSGAVFVPHTIDHLKVENSQYSYLVTANNIKLFYK